MRPHPLDDKVSAGEPLTIDDLLYWVREIRGRYAERAPGPSERKSIIVCDALLEALADAERWRAFSKGAKQ